MAQEQERYVVEFPPEVVKILDKLALRLKVSREVAIAQGIGLADLWVDARDNGRMFVECPRNKKIDEDEYEIKI